MRGSERIDISNAEIVVEVFTSSLSPRRFAGFPEGAEPTTPGVSLRKYQDLYTLTFSPEFNKSLPTGKFIITLHYHIDGAWITNRLVTEKFVNDLPGDINAFKKYYNPTPAELSLAAKFTQ